MKGDVPEFTSMRNEWKYWLGCVQGIWIMNKEMSLNRKSCVVGPQLCSYSKFRRAFSTKICIEDRKKHDGRI